MPHSEDFHAVCAQLLTPEDVKISEELYEQIVKESVVVEISSKDDQPNIKLYSLRQIYLSEVTPILDDFGFNIIDEVTFNLERSDTTVYINRFNIDIPDFSLLENAKENIVHVMGEAMRGLIFSKCRLFSLIYLQNISVREVLLLRAIIEYMNQSIVLINEKTFIDAIKKNHGITRQFLDYFLTKFRPTQPKRDSLMKELSLKIEEGIKNIPSVTDDRILKLTYEMLKNVTRTNYFFNKETIAFKIDTKTYSENLKGLQPNIESFVYNPQFSGLHLRMTKVSRGGLRWSERHDDYREEVKSLMITQEGKNSIIVPDGAKGAFVIRKDKKDITKEIFKGFYTNFINNLLDLVDNKKGTEVVKNPDIVAYDDDDTYFVVAADKGTAAMSDIANQTAIKRGFWLGDAFASGGSNGYSHKDLGITAKGAFKSVQRFFIEKGINFYEESVTMVGIGSMNGDVFGNGVLLSEHFKLLGAISHREIFIDPNPDIKVAYDERTRLFTAKSGAWSQYDTKKISEGGGVFQRDAKSITITPEMKKIIRTTRKTLSGEELAQELLKSKVDILFNGGVGTYVKSSDESNIELGDKQNEGVRIDASELQAYSVCEGGNLGFTQRARIEYAKHGGRLNLDGIDNSAGVDISDHEVNLKILLNIISDKGMLKQEDKDITLKNLTEQTMNMVLWDNYNQALAISLEVNRSKEKLHEFERSIEVLGKNITHFIRKDFFIPKNENISDILTTKGSIVRPVLASLLSYSKIFVKNILLDSNLINEPFAQTYLDKYFPKSFSAIYKNEISEHPLKNEIIATYIADKIINFQGTMFLSDYEKLGKDKFITKIKSYIISNRLFGANDIRFEIFRNDYQIKTQKQYDLLFEVEDALLFSTNWMVKYLSEHQIDASYILDYRDELFELLKTYMPNNITEIVEGKDDFNHFFAALDYLRFAIAAISIKESNSHTLTDIAGLFYLVINRFSILEILDSLNSLVIQDSDERQMRRQLRQFIEYIVVHYTHKVLSFQRHDESANMAFESYIANGNPTFEEIEEQIGIFKESDKKDLTVISITVNMLMASAI